MEDNMALVREEFGELEIIGNIMILLIIIRRRRIIIKIINIFPDGKG